MSKPMIRINTREEIIDREMNDEEYAQYLADVAAQETKAEEERAKATAKADLLAKLGITNDEAKLLLL